MISLLLATVPTVGALALHAVADHSDTLHAEMFVIEAVLVAMITGSACKQLPTSIAQPSTTIPLNTIWRN